MASFSPLNDHQHPSRFMLLAFLLCSLLVSQSAALRNAREFVTPEGGALTAVQMLERAMQEENIPEMERLLQSGDEKLAAAAVGRGMLHWASSKGAGRLVRLLLDAGAKVDSRNKQGSTALHAAATGNDLEIVHFLVSRGASVDARAISGATPLMLSAASGHAAGVAKFLELGGSPRARSKRGETALHIAAQRGDVEIAKLLIQKGAKVQATTSDEGTTALHVSVQQGARGLAFSRLLLESGASASAKMRSGLTPLVAAALAGDESHARLLLEYKADSATGMPDGLLPVHAAASNGHSGVLKLLLQNGAAVDATMAQGVTPLMAAAESARTRAAATLIEHGADVNRTSDAGENALHRAIAHSALGVARLLLQRGVHVDARTRFSGITPLLSATSAGNTEAVELLLQHGASTSVVITQSGETPLHVAAAKGWANVSQLLIDARADLNALSLREETPLHYAVSGRHASVAEMLLAHGADADAEWRRGATVLHSACESGDAAIANLLLTHGASLTASDSYGDTPAHVAAAYGHVRVVTTLLLHFQRQKTQKVDDMKEAEREGDTVAQDGAGSGAADDKHKQRKLSDGSESKVGSLGSDATGASGVPHAPEHGEELLLDMPNVYGDTPMHQAAFNDGVLMMMTMLVRGSKALDATNAHGENPLHILSPSGRSHLLAAAVGQPFHETLQERIRRIEGAGISTLGSEKLSSSALNGRGPVQTNPDLQRVSKQRKGVSPLSDEWQQAAARIPSSIERELLVDEREPLTVSAHQLVLDLAMARRSLTLYRRCMSIMQSTMDEAVMQRSKLLNATSVSRLKAAIDASASESPGSTDSMPEWTLHLRPAELEALIGSDVTQSIWALPDEYWEQSRGAGQAVGAGSNAGVGTAAGAGASGEGGVRGGNSVTSPAGAKRADAPWQNNMSMFKPIEVFLRKYSARTRPWIRMHPDVASVTVNVALSDDGALAGGALLGVLHGRVRALPRDAGDATVHASSLLHGVTRVHEGVRYSLIVFFKQKAG